MFKEFQYHLEQNLSFLFGKRILLATSGGIDSMVMVDVFRKMKFDIALAHCNFQLRGDESNEDQTFLQDYAKANAITIFTTLFDTVSFAEKHKLSIQVAARNLRYGWFKELLDDEKFDYILTAHQADDVIETFFINLSRGTGLKGLTGIPEQNNNIIRPLLPFSRNEIVAYANTNNIKWREDSSNSSDKYLRNQIRHHLIPLLNTLNPDFGSTFQLTQKHLIETQNLLNDVVQTTYNEVAIEHNDEIIFSIDKLKSMKNCKMLLYHWLEKYGFTAWNDIYNLMDSQSGKQVLAPNYKLLKNRNTLILKKNIEPIVDEITLITNAENDINFPIKLSFCKVDDISINSSSTIFVDEAKLKFPLALRKWQEGDSLQPFGMNGKSKKVSKLLKDEKKSIFEKEYIWVLCSDKQLIWVIGIRADERFKIDENTTQKLKITYTK